MHVGAPATGPVPGAPLSAVRRLYAAWNKGDFAGAAGILDPAVRWDSFQEGDAAPQGPDGLQQTMAGGASGGTWVFSGVTVDLLVEAGFHVIALCRRSGAQALRLEVWTVRGERVVRFRGFPLEDGMQALSETTGSHRLEALCRGLAAFNRRDLPGWLALFHADAQIVNADRRAWSGHQGLVAWVADLEGRLPGARLDDVIVRAESQHTVVVSAELRAPLGVEGLELVVAFDGELVRWIAAYPTADQALGVARDL